MTTVFEFVVFAVLVAMAGCVSTRPDARGVAAHAFRDCSQCPEMIVIPAGRFEMGSPRLEQDWSVAQGRRREYTDRESPVHTVNLSRPFAVGVFEVTRDEFALFVLESGYNATGGVCDTFEADGGKIVRAKRPDRDWRNVGHEQSGRHPAVCLTWHDAKAYAAWLATKSGHNYRLLTEAEWEYVARSGTSTARYWGNDFTNSDICQFANTADATPLPTGETWSSHSKCIDGHWATSPVGSFRPSDFGVHDILGNVWEWVEDCGQATYANAPGDGSAQHGPICETRAIRGGAFHEGGGYVRAAVRGLSAPDLRFNNSGFRVARDLP